MRKNSCKTTFFYSLDYLFCFFITSLLVSFLLPLPMFHLTFSSAVINSVTSVAWSEFVLWWIVWSVAGCTFKGFWNERRCCSSFFFVHDLEWFDGILKSLLCWFFAKHFYISFGIGFVHSITHTSSSTSAFNCSWYCDSSSDHRELPVRWLYK